jgi:hypothetical protein
MKNGSTIKRSDMLILITKKRPIVEGKDPVPSELLIGDTTPGDSRLWHNEARCDRVILFVHHIVAFAWLLGLGGMRSGGIQHR